MHQKINGRPSNQTPPKVRRTIEQAVSAAFMQYLASTGPFAEWKEEWAEWEQLMVSGLSWFDKTVTHQNKHLEK